MNTKLQSLVEPAQMFEQIEQIADRCNCSVLEAIEEYSRINGVDISVVAAHTKSLRGPLKTRLLAESADLRLIKRS